jgi:hypothetical protein
LKRICFSISTINLAFSDIGRKEYTKVLNPQNMKILTFDEKFRDVKLYTSVPDTLFLMDPDPEPRIRKSELWIRDVH